MIEHVSVQVSDYSRSKDLYKKALAPLGYELSMDMPQHEAAGFAEGGHTSFWIEKDEHPKGVHVAFRANSKEEVDSFYKEALSVGSTDNGMPGYREDYGPGYYAAYVHDPDGNNIEAVWFDSSKETSAR